MRNKRCIVIVLDGFGIGEMPDVPVVRPQDKGANTAGKLLSHFSKQRLPTLEKLGLNNAVECSKSIMLFSPKANVGKMHLAHEGGDTFMGHQEIMGTHPEPPHRAPFSDVISDVEQQLLNNSYDVDRVYRDGLAMLCVNEAVLIGDNLEADLGQVYNLCANLDQISFSQLRDIAAHVRGCNKASRNIAFGGHVSNLKPLLDAIQTRQGKYIGLNVPKTGVYDHGFEVIHLGYGVNIKTQVPHQLNDVNTTSYLYGKVADIVGNPHGVSYPSIVDTTLVFDLLLNDLDNVAHGFFCLNVQETDLSGHQQDPEQYWRVLALADQGIHAVLEKLTEHDLLVVTADHGNDPFIGHSNHTREQVPLLVHHHNVQSKPLGTRTTLADLGATVCDFFDASAPESGRSFLSEITNSSTNLDAKSEI
jgi:phosphopentomutase